MIVEPTPKSNNSHYDNPLAFAQAAVERGLVVIPLAGREGKQPIAGAGWQHTTLEQARAHLIEWFGRPVNVGLVLGVVSNHIVDTDLDSPAAIAAAPYLLPKTPMRWGRLSNGGQSHLGYRIVGQLPSKGVLIENDLAGKRIVELRCSRAQTLIYGRYLHPETGQPVEPVVGTPLAEPTALPLQRLQQAVARLAAACIIASRWNEGQRHTIALPLAGALFRLSWTRGEIEAFFRAICAAAGDPEMDDRLRAISDTEMKLLAGAPASGWPQLAAQIGDDAATAVRAKLSVAGVDLTDLLLGVETPQSQPTPPSNANGEGEQPPGEPPPTQPPDVEPADEPPDEPLIPKVLLSTKERRVNDQIAHNLWRERNLYVRGGQLCRLIHPSDGNAPTIRAVDKGALREIISSAVNLVEIVRRGEVLTEELAHPPNWAVAALLERGDWPRLPILDSVCEFPLLLANAELVTASGYHRRSRCYVHIPSTLKVGVPENPTADDVRNAVETLLGGVGDFPFEQPHHRSAWLAGLLSPLARQLFTGPTPMFLVSANVRGSGKSMLCDAAALLALGRSVPVMTYTADDSEMRKRLTSLLIEGSPIGLIDNIVEPLGGGSLDAFLTAHTWTDRILGSNRMITLQPRLVLWATANNPVVQGDSWRRIVPIALHAPEARPEHRAGFRHADLRGYIRAHRGELLSAAFTLLRGWLRAGAPSMGVSALGSFESWSHTVRACLLWAGLPDPIPASDGQGGVDLADTEAAQMQIVLHALREIDPRGEGLTASEICDLCVEVGITDRPPAYHSLRDSLGLLLPRVTPHALGLLFRRFSKRWLGDLRLIGLPTRTRAMRWRVECRAQPRAGVEREEVAAPTVGEVSIIV